ncbi:MAG: extracellular solute-binding protein, partial [Calditrichaeota bacterium]
MKRLVFLGLIIALQIGYGCSKKPPALVVYTTHGKELVQTFVDQFERKNPGVRVEWLDMGSQDALDRIRSERANPQADIWWGAPSPIFMRATKEKLLQPYRPTWASQVDSLYHDPADHWYATFLTPEVIAFNSEKLTRATAPQDWDDLLQPQWKGRIVLRSPLA